MLNSAYPLSYTRHSELVDDMLTVKALHCVKKNINTSRLALVVTLTLQLTTVDEVKGGSYKQTSTVCYSLQRSNRTPLTKP